jgi:hypothetical protein
MVRATVLLGLRRCSIQHSYQFFIAYVVVRATTNVQFFFVDETATELACGCAAL